MTMDKTKILMVGWDGATFDILLPLAKEGRLPNFARLMQNGSWGRMSSTIPPLTPVAWTTISTGVNPGRHGIFDAMSFSRQELKVRFVNARARRVKPVWTILSEAGRKVGVMNVPVTYPPDRVDGFCIPGMFSPEGAPDFMHPAALMQEIEKNCGRYLLECRQVDDPDEYLKLILEMVDYRERAALYLQKKFDPDFFFVAFMASDRVQHFFWKYLDKTHPHHSRHRDSIAKVYERLDKTLGRLIDAAGGDTAVVMVSDHGSGPLKKAFFLNNWLAKNGYLKLKQDPGEVFRPGKRSKVISGIKKSIKRIIPESVLNNIRKAPAGDGVNPERGSEELSAFIRLIDWEGTTAFSEGVAGGIFINRDNVSDENYGALIEDIRKRLLELRDGDVSVIDAIYASRDVYSGDALSSAPDLIPICAPGYQVIAPNEFFFFGSGYSDALFIPHRWSGRHEMEGIFVASGRAVEQGKTLKNITVQDVAPMVLYLMGSDIPDGLDGRVCLEAIKKDYASENPVKYTKQDVSSKAGPAGFSEREEKEITDKLKSLGYME